VVTTARARLKATADRLRKDPEKEMAVKKAAEDELKMLVADGKLRELYRINARVGSEHIAGDTLPMLKIHSGKSQGNVLTDGSEPNKGWFFHTKTQKQYETVEVYILSISRGYHAKAMERGKDPQFNQLMAGMVVEDMAPFIMYVSGLKLQNMWEFGKEIAAYTKSKSMPIPMFTMRVRLSTSLKSHSYGKSYIVDFELIRDKNGHPVVVTEAGLFNVLRDGVQYVQGVTDSIIERAEQEVSGMATAREAEEILGEPPGPPKAF
jgi:hypothetical protein